MKLVNVEVLKPTQAMEDGINAGIITWLLEGTKFKIGRKWAVNAYEEHKESINKIINLLPKDFHVGHGKLVGTN